MCRAIDPCSAHVVAHEARYASDRRCRSIVADHGGSGGAASGLFTAAQGLATKGAVDNVDVTAVVIAQRVDDLAANVSRTQVVGSLARGVAKLGPVAMASTVVANFNAVIQEGGSPRSLVQAGTHVTFDVAALGAAASVGAMVGGAPDALVAIAGFTAHQIVGAPIKENVTKLLNGQQNVGDTLVNSWNGAADNLAVTGDAIVDGARGLADTVAG